MHSSASPLTTAIGKAMKHSEPQVRLAAVEAIGRCGGAGNVRGLLAVARDFASSDPTTRQASRIAIRNLTRDPNALELLLKSWKFDAAPDSITRMTLAIDDPLAIEMASILPALDNALAAEALLNFVDKNPNSNPELIEAAVRNRLSTSVRR